MKAFGLARRSLSSTGHVNKRHDNSEDDDFTLIVIAKILHDDTRDDGVRRQDQDQQEVLSALHGEEPSFGLRRLTWTAKRMSRAPRAWRKPKDLSHPRKEVSNGCVACW